MFESTLSNLTLNAQSTVKAIAERDTLHQFSRKILVHDLHHFFVVVVVFVNNYIVPSGFLPWEILALPE